MSEGAPAPVPVWRARVDENSGLHWRDAGRFAGFLARLRGRDVEVTVRPERKRRSLKQNAWYWAAIVPAVQQYLSEGRTFPLTEEQTHYLLKFAFIGTEETPLGPVPISTTTLDVEQYSTFCERIRAHAASEWGLPIPGPEEWMR